MTLPPGWIDASLVGSPDVSYIQMSSLECDDVPFVNCSLVIREDSTWQLNVHNHPVLPSSPIVAGVGSCLDAASASVLLSRVSALHTCPGNPEPKFVSLASGKQNGEFLSSSKEVVAFLDTNGSVKVKEMCYKNTIRATKCLLLTEELRCAECTRYRKSLIVQHSRASVQTTMSKKVNYRLE